MCVISSSDLLLEYLFRKGEVDNDMLVTDIFNICDKLSKRNVFTPIDFSTYNGKLRSDVLCDNLWYYLSCNVITEHYSTLSYCVTDFGKSVSDFLLKRARENNPEAWSIVSSILSDTIQT